MIQRLHRQLRESLYLRNVLWQMSGNSVAMLLGIAAMPILTRIYSPANFAVLNLFSQIVAALTILLTWRFEYLIILPKEDARAHAILRLILWVGATLTAVSTLIIGLEGDFIVKLLGDTELRSWLVLAPLTAWLICLSVGLQQFVQRHQDFRNTGIAEIMGKGGYILSAFAGFAFLPFIGGLIATGAVGAACKSLWLWCTLRSPKYTELNTLPFRAVEVIRPYIKMAGAMSCSNSISIFTAAIPTIFIFRFYGAETLGQFSLVISTLYLPSSLLSNAIGQVYYQSAAQRQAHGQAFDDVWRNTAWQLIRIGVPLYACIALLSPWAYSFFFGDQWNNAGKYAVVMSLASGMSFITTPLDRTCMVVNAWWYSLLWHSLRLITVSAVVWFAREFQWAFDVFLIALVLQMSLLYLIDWFAGRRFALEGKRFHV